MALAVAPAPPAARAAARRTQACRSSRAAPRCASAAHQLRRTDVSLLGVTNGARTTAVWLDNTARVEAPGVSLPLAWEMWQNKAEIPLWMPWITSVTVQADDPRMSRWALSTVQFGQTLEFAWIARDLTPITNQKIHWVSQGGLPNRGAVTFYPRPDGCALQLAISYELPTALLPVGEGVRPVVEGILRADMERFVALAQQRVKAKAAGR